LFERHHRALFDFLVRMTGNVSVAEDLVQDVFVRVLKYRATWRSEGGLKRGSSGSRVTRAQITSGRAQPMRRLTKRPNIHRVRRCRRSPGAQS
jgi:hypothetical protein